MPMAMANTPLDTPKRACSWLKIAPSIERPPRPPYSVGQVMPAHPPPASTPCHSRQRFTYTSSEYSVDHIPAEKSSGWPFGMALASSQARASARNAASSGVSSKSTAAQTRTRSSPAVSP